MEKDEMRRRILEELSELSDINEHRLFVRVSDGFSEKGRNLMYTVLGELRAEGVIDSYDARFYRMKT